MSLTCLRVIVLLTAMTPFLGGRAHAELGGPLSSVVVDGGRMGARVASTRMGGYTRHDLTRANGAMVHELTNAEGQVFAVTWSGPGKPDLHALLGARFTNFQAANDTVRRTTRSLRRPPQVNEPDLQIQTGGHMGWFHGVAFIPSLAPAHFSTTDLAQEP